MTENNGTKTDLRALALSLLTECDAAEKYANLALSSPKYDDLTAKERSALTALFYTAVEHRLTYRYLIAALAGRSHDRIAPHTERVLTLGLCQLLDLDGVPDFAAINETVKLCRDPGERSFVNALLRRAQNARDEGTLPFPERKKNPARFLSVRYSFPLGTVKRFLSLYGEEESERLLQAYNLTAPLTVAVNLKKISVSAFLALLKEHRIDAEATAFSPIGVRILTPCAPKELPGFDEGLFHVQDEASQIAVAALAPKAGDRLIDVCSAPGGKSFTALSLTEGKLDVHSFDLHGSKISLIRGGAKRLGFSLVAEERDALTPDPALLGQADLVICDVPCSGLGVLGKKPDLRYKDLGAVKDLPALQLAILEASAGYLRKNGRLLYSTCTLLPEENKENIVKFTEKHGNFSFVPFSVGMLSSNDGMLTLLPHRHGTDGFFIALLQKNE